MTLASASASRLLSAARPFSDPNAGLWLVRNYGLALVVCLWRSLSGLGTAPLASRPLHRSIPVSFGQTEAFGSCRSQFLQNFQEVQASPLLGGGAIAARR